MKLILVLTVFSLVLVQAFGATTIMSTTHTHHNTGTHPHKTHPTREPVKKDSISFIYDPKATRLITMIGETTKTYPMLSQAAVSSTSHIIARICNRSGWTAYKLN